VQIGDTYSQSEKDWYVKHAHYVEKEILNKIILGVHK
jgi:hypothetical protein